MQGSIVFVVGLQKSGTTLMTRLLLQSGVVGSPWTGEGHDYWGDEPPFSPAGQPTGTVYQRHQGALGHEIGVADATPDVRELLTTRLHELPEITTPFAVNKNPYNVSRLPWLRALFPNACIVAVIRRPTPNVFSLFKKHSMAGEASIPPEEGWWGVKPRGWRGHLEDGVIDRCAWQWSAVNRKLDEDRAFADHVVAYHRLCEDPTYFVERVLGRTLDDRIAPVRCLDDEFCRGAELRSKNRYYWRTKSLSVPSDEAIEIGPLDEDALAEIEQNCRETELLFPELE